MLLLCWLKLLLIYYCNFCIIFFSFSLFDLLYGHKLSGGENFANFAIFAHFRESLNHEKIVSANSPKLIPGKMS